MEICSTEFTATNNPMTDRYDMAPKEYVNKYNAMEGQWGKTTNIK